MKKIGVVVLSLCWVVVGAMPLYAQESSRGKMTTSKERSMQDMFYSKTKAIYKNQKQLGVSEAQMAEVRALKTEMKKIKIKNEADIRIIKMDIRSLMHADEVDLGAVNALIDRKYDLSKEISQRAVASCAQLKNILSPEQRKSLEELLIEDKSHSGKKSDTVCTHCKARMGRRAEKHM